MVGSVINMKRKTTVILLIVIIFLIGAIFYISWQLNSDINGTSPIVPRKTKAASKTYSKLIALNVTGTASPTNIVEPTLEPTIEPTIEVLPTNIISPTEIILAYANPTEAITSASYSSQLQSTPTGVNALPETGFINNTLIVFAVSGLLIFISFIF